MPEAIHVDIAILGAGTAGLGARRAALAEGRSVLLIDPGPLGTTCARVGCMPSKLLIAAANAAHHAAEAAAFGVHADVTIDGGAVLRRVQAERDRFVGFVDEAIAEAEERGELLRERAVVTAPGELRAGEHTVRYERLVIATGSAPFVPPPYRDLPPEVALTNEGIFELTALPESVLVVGLGVIGLELGQALHRLGVRTTLLGVGGGIGPLSDPEVRAQALHHLGDELDLHPEHELISVTPEGAGVRVQFVDSRGVARDERFERVFLAAGRRPGLARLGLEALGVSPDARGAFPVDPETLQLADLPVFVAGDANGLRPLLHEAVDDGRIAGRNAARYPEILAPLRRTPIAIVFSEPQMAIVGQSYRELSGCDVSVGAVDYGTQGRARVENVHRGKVRIYADHRTHRLVGAELFGPRVEHLAHLLSWAIQAQMSVEEALAMPFYHPVVEEGIRTALRKLAAALRAQQPIACVVAEQGVGA